MQLAAKGKVIPAEGWDDALLVRLSCFTAIRFEGLSRYRFRGRNTDRMGQPRLELLSSVMTALLLECTCPRCRLGLPGCPFGARNRRREDVVAQADIDGKVSPPPPPAPFRISPAMSPKIWSRGRRLHVLSPPSARRLSACAMQASDGRRLRDRVLAVIALTSPSVGLVVMRYQSYSAPSHLRRPRVFRFRLDSTAREARIRTAIGVLLPFAVAELGCSRRFLRSARRR